MSNKSWGLTLAVYLVALSTIVGSVYFDIEITEQNQAFIAQMITITTGSTTAGGVFLSVMKRKRAFEATIKELQKMMKDLDRKKTDGFESNG